MVSCTVIFVTGPTYKVLHWLTCYRVQLNCDGTRWRMGVEVRGNWRMEWVACTLYTTLEYGVSSITTADAHTSAASSRLNWHSHWFKWTGLFRQKTKSGFCMCAITFQMQSTWVQIIMYEVLRTFADTFLHNGHC